MPLDAIRQLTAPARSRVQNVRLGAGLAFVAGATNAGAFLAVGQYTSHMTGIVSTMADAIALQRWAIAAVSLSAVVAFVMGAATTAVLVNFAHRRKLSSAFALPLLLEAVLLLLFGAFGAWLSTWHAFLAPAAVGLLCFTMGLQNAVITKVSRAEIRTTHVTGVVTDLGIELGKLVYVNRTEREKPVRASRARLRVLTLLLLSFVIGGVLGSVGFQKFGYIATVPLALLLGVFALVPALDDVRMRLFPRSHSGHSGRVVRRRLTYVDSSTCASAGISAPLSLVVDAFVCERVVREGSATTLLSHTSATAPSITAQ